MANGEKGKGRSQNQRLKLFYLLDYLLEQTDETHTVKVQEIIEHFDNYYKIPVEQKTVCSDLHLLDEYGYETQYDGRTRGWRIVDREFDTQELQLLIDSVQSSRFITQKQAKNLTDKLKAKASRYDRVLLDRWCYVPNRVRSSGAMGAVPHTERYPHFIDETIKGIDRSGRGSFFLRFLF